MDISRANIPAILSSSDLPACCHQRNEANDFTTRPGTPVPVQISDHESQQFFQGIELQVEHYCE
jgi:hypothetical protein